MKPLILQYTQKPNEANFNLHSIRYSTELSLSVCAQTGRPAIDSFNMSTQTLTRTNNEDSDSDNDRASMMGTMTKTSYQLEGTDDDANFIAIKSLMATGTVTLVNHEASDSDRG